MVQLVMGSLVEMHARKTLKGGFQNPLSKEGWKATVWRRNEGGCH
jgi:hypothetical protein